MSDDTLTGVRETDRALDDGLPPGSLVALTSPPTGRPLLNASIHLRETLYFTTVRTATAVEAELDRLLTDPKIDDIVDVGADGTLVDILVGMTDLDEGEDVIVDVFDPLEAATDFVWELRPRRERGKLSCGLSVPKTSGMTLEDDDRVFDLEPGESVAIDTSRDIA